MLFPDGDAPLLKQWIVKRLENTSDADADVLADYVLALLRHDGDIEDVRKLCEEEIQDFLRDDTSTFINDVFEAIRYKSYVPGAPPPPKQQQQFQNAQPSFTGLGASSLPQAPPPYSQSGPRKRTFQDRGEADALNGRDQFQGNRLFKQPRRGGGGFGARGGRMDDMNGSRGGRPQYGYQNAPESGPTFPPAGMTMPQFDPNNPMDAIMKMQELSKQMGIPMPPMPDFSQQHGYQPQRQQRRRGRCRDYDTKGYCARGENCMFEHTMDSANLPAPQSSGHIVVPTEEYDPNTATMMTDLPSQMPRFNSQATPFQSNGRHPGTQRNSNRGGYQQHHSKRRPRAEFSADGPTLDRTKSTIVIENIPEDYFEEEYVRSFFGQFGNIVEVSMKPYKRLAIVKFETWDAANAAYRSPKVVFDNRFVKVFWRKEDGPADDSTNGNGSTNGKNGSKPEFPDQQWGADDASEDIDMEEFNRKQEEAQKLHEEKMQKKQELEKKRLELETKRKELLAKQEAEKQRLLAKIAGKSRKNSSGSNDVAMEQNGGTDGTKSSAQTEALKATLAKLQEEAKLYGLDPNGENVEEEEYFPPWSSMRGRGRGRGGYFPPRGRGGYQPRGAYRGGARGRGEVHAAYAAFSLDNRPRKVAVSGVDFTAPEKDEALKRHLFGLGDFTDVQTSPTSALITFKDRKAAEGFFYGVTNKEIPGVEGQVELSWVNNTAGSLPQPSGSTNTGNHENGNNNLKSDDVTMTGSNGAADPSAMEHGNNQQQENAEMDYDVADQNDWDIE